MEKTEEQQEPKVENASKPKGVPKWLIPAGIVIAFLVIGGGAGVYFLGKKVAIPGVRVTTDGKNETATIVENGVTTVGGEDVKKLPDNYPKELPLYPGGVVKVVSVDADSVLAGFETKDKFAVAVTKYKNELIKNGWTVTGGVNPEANELKMEMMEIRNSTYAGTAQIIGKDEDPARVINLIISKEELKRVKELENYNPADYE